MFDLEKAIAAWRRRFKTRRTFLSNDLDELEGHLRDHMERLMEEGLTEKEAFQQAMWRLGDAGSIEESYRKTYWLKLKTQNSYWRAVLKETAMLGDYTRQDVMYTLRILFKKPLFTMIAILALAIGIGANTAIFSIVNSVLLQPLPYKDADQIVHIWETNLSRGWDRFSVAPANYVDWREQNRVFQDLAVFNGTMFTLTGDGDPVRIPGARLTANVFPIMGVNPIHGRVFLPEEDQPGQDRVVLISHGLWQRQFGSDRSTVGRTINLDGVGHQVIGIMPPDFNFPASTEIWRPIAFTENNLASRGGHYLGAVARLNEGVTLDQAQSALQTIAGRLEDSYPNTNTGWSTTIIPLREVLVGDIQTSLYILLGAVLCVLLIACANVANLLLARAATRQKELAIRTAVGAGRGRLMRQLLTEYVILACIGGLLGVLLAYWGIDALRSLAPANLPRIDEIAIDMRVLGFTALLSLATGVIVGLIPAFQASSPDQTDTLKDGGRRSTTTGRSIVRHALVGFEIAMSLVLLIGAGLLIKSFDRIQNVDPGFNTDQILTVDVVLPRSSYAENEQRIAFMHQALERMRALPGVQTASVAAPLPFTWDSVYGFVIEGRPPLEPGQTPSANYYGVSDDYFETMGISIMKGRSFTAQDREGSQRVAIINEKMAQDQFPNQDPIGQRIHITNGPQTWREIVGVVSDVKHYGLENPRIIPQMYEPIFHAPSRFMTITLRTVTDPAELTTAVRSQVGTLDKNLPVDIQTMESLLSSSVAQRRFSMLLLSTFAVVALVLAALGVFGVISYTVSQRTHEIGIRMALGARPADVLKQMVGHSMIPVLIGAGLGLVGAFGLMRLLESLLFNVETTDPLTFIGVTVFLIVIALLACYFPARRAMRVSPTVALRYE